MYIPSLNAKMGGREGNRLELSRLESQETFFEYAATQTALSVNRFQKRIVTVRKQGRAGGGKPRRVAR